MANVKPQEFQFDRSKTKLKAGANIMLIILHDCQISLAFLFDFTCSNNQAKYQALIIGLQLLPNMQVLIVVVYGDFLLVLSQVSNEYRCKHESLVPYCSLIKSFLSIFFSLKFSVRKNSKEANNLALQFRWAQQTIVQMGINTSTCLATTNYSNGLQ